MPSTFISPIVDQIILIFPLVSTLTAENRANDTFYFEHFSMMNRNWMPNILCGANAYEHKYVWSVAVFIGRRFVYKYSRKIGTHVLSPSSDCLRSFKTQFRCRTTVQIAIAYVLTLLPYTCASVRTHTQTHPNKHTHTSRTTNVWECAR